MFKSRTLLPTQPKAPEIDPLIEEDAEDETDGGDDGDEEELFIDLESLLKYHRSVRIRVPPQTSSSEGSDENGARELVVSKDDYEESGVVF